MRQAGTISAKQDADRFSAYLLIQGISSKVEPDGNGFAIWIHDENVLDRSRQELAQFKLEPTHARYQVEAQAEQVRREAAERARQAQKNMVDVRDQWSSPWRRRPITLAIIAICVLAQLELLTFPDIYFPFSIPSIRHGEVWRLITPIFLHGGPIHLLVNMWMLYDMGSLLEPNLGRVRYVLLILFTALVSNLTQYWWDGPNFLGMSGVVYGLFGYAWLRSRLDPTAGCYIRPDLVVVMLGWLVVGPMVLANIANAAHIGGLISGAAAGAAHAWYTRLRRS